MPVTTATQIIIDLAGYMQQVASPPSDLLANQIIYLRELPPAGSGAFALRVLVGDNRTETQLSAAEAEQLATLLAQLPAHSMAAPARSFDGVTYELTIRQAEHTLTFHWQNDDWQFSLPDSRPKWERVAALVVYALNLAQKKGATS